MIFTAGPLARSQTTSQKFKDMGALNLAPTTIGEVRVTGVKARISDVCSFLLANLWVYTAQILLSKAIKPTLTVLATNVALSVDLFPRPAMITSIRAPNETILPKLLALVLHNRPREITNSSRDRERTVLSVICFDARSHRSWSHKPRSTRKKDAETEERHERRRVRGMGMLGLMPAPALKAGPLSQAKEMSMDDMFADLLFYLVPSARSHGIASGSLDPILWCIYVGCRLSFIVRLQSD